MHIAKTSIYSKRNAVLLPNQTPESALCILTFLPHLLLEKPLLFSNTDLIYQRLTNKLDLILVVLLSPRLRVM